MNNKLVVFSLLTCAFSWACWFPIMGRLKSSPFESSGVVLALFFLGAYGPTIMGILLTYIYERGEGLKALFKRAINIRVGFKYLLVCFLAGPLFYAISVGLYVISGGELGAVNFGLLPWLPVVFIVPVVFGPLAEEFGWRGFALPLLDHKNRFVSSSIIIGVIWAFWHAPLFWAPTGTAISGLPVSLTLVGLFFMAVIGSSFIYTWLFNKTAGSLFVAIFLHLSMNATGTIVGMLFPELTQGQKLLMYKLYALGLWAVLAIAFGFAWIQNRRGVERERSAH